MSKWSKLYEQEIKSTTLENYVSNKLKSKKQIIKLINKYSPNNKVMEFGSGTGILALYLSTMNKHVTALDLDNDMIKLSKKYFLPYFKDANINYVNTDIRDFNTDYNFDVTYSIGVLEHYSDKEIIDLLHKQLTMSNYVIFGIPTTYFDEAKKMYGNERYLSLRYWRKLIKQSKCKIIKESSYHYLNIFQRLINLKKWFKPNPVHIFVVQNLEKAYENK